MDPVNGGKVRTTTIRLTPRDQKSIEKLMELTGGNLTSTIRYAIRRTLWAAKLPLRVGMQHLTIEQVRSEKRTVSVIEISRQLT